MILYHGSNVEVNKPKIIKSKRALDFGIGFYLTSDFEQAQKWAVRTASRRETGDPIVSVFDVDDNKFASLKILLFDSAGKEWLKYVSANRTDKLIDDIYDVVVGPVANDQTIRTLNNYLSGYLTEDIAIQLLLPQRLKDQYAFKTEKALSVLKFSEVKIV